MVKRKPPVEHDPQKRSSGASVATWASLSISVLALVAYFVQASIMREAMRVDQRAWVSVVTPTAFPLNGTSIPVVTQIVNSGKTPARAIEGDVVATVLNRGEEMALGDFTVGHPEAMRQLQQR